MRRTGRTVVGSMLVGLTLVGCGGGPDESGRNAPTAQEQKGFAAAQEEDWDTVRSLLADGVDINAGDAQGETLLHMATQSGEKQMIAFLLDKGADPEIKDEKGYTAMNWAAIHDQLEVVELLRQRGAKLDIFAAIDLNRIEEIQKLIAADADLLSRPQATEGDQPLHYACIDGRLAIIKLLVAKGADVNATTGVGNTPMHLVAEFGNKAVVAYLLDEGAKVSPKNEFGMTPLKRALSAREENAERPDKVRALDQVIQLLRSRGATE
jgi:uncharacterized protein